MYVYVVTSDFRENHPQVRTVHTTYDAACKDAKRYILQNNDEDYIQADKYLNARKFVAKYTSSWLTSGSIVRRKVT